MQPQLSLFLLLLILSQPAISQVYKWVDKNGNIHFSDKQPETQQSEEVELKEINSFKGVSYSDTQTNIGKKVIMYSASWCGYCKKASRYFKKNGIPYTEYDIEKNRKAKREYDKLGGRGVPLILVGKKKMSGFSAAGFERLYKQ